MFELPEMDDLDIYSFYVQHHPNDHPTLEHFAAFYLGIFYKQKQKLKRSHFLTHNALDILTGIKKRMKHFNSII